MAVPGPDTRRNSTNGLYILISGVLRDVATGDIANSLLPYSGHGLAFVPS